MQGIMQGMCLQMHAQPPYLGVMRMLLQAQDMRTLLNIVLQITSTTVHALVGQTTQALLHERKTSALK